MLVRASKGHYAQKTCLRGREWQPLGIPTLPPDDASPLFCIHSLLASLLRCRPLLQGLLNALISRRVAVEQMHQEDAIQKVEIVVIFRLRWERMMVAINAENRCRKRILLIA